MKAINIDWDTDEQDVAEEVLDYASQKEIADLLKVDEKKIANINQDDLYDLIRDTFHHRPGLMDDYLGLPSSIEIPENVEKNEIADWLTSTYEYCIRGFELI